VHLANFVKNLNTLHHLNVEIPITPAHTLIENRCWKPRSGIWCGFLCELKTPSRVNPASSVVKTSIILLENSESSLPASKSQSDSESDSPNEIMKGATF
jgi:hypothetical protein